MGIGPELPAAHLRPIQIWEPPPPGGKLNDRHLACLDDHLLKFLWKTQGKDRSKFAKFVERSYTVRTLGNFLALGQLCTAQLLGK